MKLTLPVISTIINISILVLFIAYFFFKSFPSKNAAKGFATLTFSTFAAGILSVIVQAYIFPFLVLILFVTFYLKAPISQKLSALLFLLTFLFCAEALCSFFLYYLPSLFSGESIELYIYQSQTSSPIFILFSIANIVLSSVSILLGTKLWNMFYRYLNLTVMCELFLYPHILLSEFMQILFRVQHKWLILPILIILIVIGNAAVFHGFQNVLHVLSEVHSDQYQRKKIMIQLSSFQSARDQLMKMRKWNHDMDNHLQTIEYLLQNSDIRHTEQYLSDLIQSMQDYDSTSVKGDSAL